MIESCVAGVSRFVAVLGGIVSLICLVLICVSVGSRYFAGQPQSWIDHAAAWLVVAVVMLAAAETQRRDEHIGVEVLRNRLRGPSLRVARIFSVASVALVSAILLREGIETVSFSRMIGIATDIEAVPKWWLHLLIPLGAGLLLLVALAQLAVLLTGGDPRGPAPKSDIGAPGQTTPGQH